MNTGQGGTGDYSFVNGGSLSFTGTADSSQQLTINGSAPYTLIFNQADLLNINNPNNESGGLSGDYALALPLDFAAGDTATVFTGAPIASTVYAPFMGTFLGLGNTISNLNIQEVTPIGQQTASGFGTNGVLGLFGVVTGDGRSQRRRGAGRQPVPTPRSLAAMASRRVRWSATSKAAR